MTDRKLFAQSERNEPNEDLEKGAGGAGAPQRFRADWPTESGGLDETGSLGPRPPLSPGEHLPPFPPPPLSPPLGPFNFDRTRLIEHVRPENVRHRPSPLADIPEVDSPISDLRHTEPRRVTEERYVERQHDDTRDLHKETAPFPRSGTTRMPRRLVSTQVLDNLSYPYREEVREAPA